MPRTAAKDGKAARQRMSQQRMDEPGGRQAFLLRGDELRQLRVSVGLSQRDLATRLNYSPAQVSKWEQGRSAIPRRVYDAIRREVEREREERAEWERYLAALHLPPVPRSDLSSLSVDFSPLGPPFPHANFSGNQPA